MSLFRSEEHAALWLEGRPEPPGETIPADTLWRLADAWYADRVSPGWRPRTRAENQAILDRLGLTGPFWSLE